MPLMAAHPLALAQLPLGPGLYRVRRAGASDGLEWIGWADRGVREAVERLSRQVHLRVEPYDDPATHAHALWRLRRAQSVSFDVSGALLSDAGSGQDLLQRAWDDYRSLVRNT
jgi:hypothetical protein